MPTSTETTPVWFITGCSRGLGRALAERVLQRGYRAVLTARNPAQVKGILDLYEKRSLALALDVTDSSQVEKAVTQAAKTFGRIDVLVNNAGYGYYAAVEEGEVRAMFETNFFGLLAVTKCVLPGMRAQSHGHIINISSVGGLLGNSSSGYYNATKFAVEGLSEALAKEVEPLGIHVTVIEPGPSRTNWIDESMRQTRHPIEAYAKTAGARRAEIARISGKQAGDPVRIAEAIIKIAESPKPPLHLVLGKNGLERVRAKIDKLASSMDEWEAVSISTDFPQS
jgi:NAD(P)-dependent dehydrogenase (short-subunit alcohol dehydrogenase family)